MENGWKRITTGEGLGVTGLLAIRHKPTGRTYYIKTGNIAKRLWDHRHLLQTGKHHNRELQKDWSADPAAFAFYAFCCSKPDVLDREFRLHVQAERATGSCYNRKWSAPLRY